MFRDKVYWILMPIFLLSAVLLFFYLPEGQKLYSFLVVLIFWVVYPIVKFLTRSKID